MGDWQTFSFVLTVAEGKRLIARAVVVLPAVQRALREGMVIVCKGSTNAYVAEELLGHPLAKGSYVLGRTVPATADTAAVFTGNTPEVILVKGEPSALTLKEALAQAACGDVVIKGANALNHDRGLAGVLIGHSEGGTVGALIGAHYGRGLHLVIPVGLEKEIAADLGELAAARAAAPELTRQDGTPSLWPLQGEIVTELEALALLTGAEVVQLGAGGVCGAEGGSWFSACGTAEQVAAARDLVREVQGEPPFGH